ncbi:MAG TPA: hypothetical protein VHY56_13160 [Candidatus Binataceae bacterium]|nr:hypothetical protein [Candidatus Binataceae bacterium]
MTKSNIVAAVAALAHAMRLDIFRLLVAHGPEGMAAGEELGAQHHGGMRDESVGQKIPRIQCWERSERRSASRYATSPGGVEI